MPPPPFSRSRRDRRRSSGRRSGARLAGVLLLVLLPLGWSPLRQWWLQQRWSQPAHGTALALSAPPAAPPWEGRSTAAPPWPALQWPELSWPDLPWRELPLLAAVLPVQPAGLEGIGSADLLARLRQADAGWTPRAERLPDGRIRYHYRRRTGEPPLSLAEVQWRIANPPGFEREQRQIGDLLETLARAGVRIRLEEPRKPGAAGEWDPRARTLRIRPRVVASGSADFALVLNHEAIHVAQSCHGGSLRGRPAPIGLDQTLRPEQRSVLQEPVYRSAGPLERQLEREAYANQRHLHLGAELLRRHCRLAAAASAASPAAEG